MIKSTSSMVFYSFVSGELVYEKMNITLHSIQSNEREFKRPQYVRIYFLCYERMLPEDMNVRIHILRLLHADVNLNKKHQFLSSLNKNMQKHQFPVRPVFGETIQEALYRTFEFICVELWILISIREILYVSFSRPHEKCFK